MSKIGKKNIIVPKESSIKIEGSNLTISGPKGSKVLSINDKIFSSKMTENQFEILPHLSKPQSYNFFLIGDALRSIHPVAGQGWNLGIKDIQQLMTLLGTHDLNSQNLIKTFYNYRSIESFGYLSFTNILNSLYENQNPLTKLLINFGFKSLSSSPHLRSIFIKQAMGRLNLI